MSVVPSHETRGPAQHNIAWQLTRTAKDRPHQIAIAAPRRSPPRGRDAYETMSFAQLDADSSHLAAALQSMGAGPGKRIVLLVKPGIDFISLTFALFKTGAVVVLIDPGMGRQHLLQCLEDVQPDGFVAIPLVQLARRLHRRRFPQARINVTVGRRLLGLGPTLQQLRRRPVEAPQVHDVDQNTPAAIIFTTGSTGPPKGVLYTHGNFSTQVQQLSEYYQIQAGEVDLPGFPLFALFNSALGVTTVIPDMDPRRPAEVDPQRIVQAVQDWDVTQAFGSPAIWNVVGRYCEQQNIELRSLRRVLSAGAPVPPHVLQRMMNAMGGQGEVHTPYGATESLPVASITATEILQETAADTSKGKGTCVGRRFSAIEWRVIRIDDGPLADIKDTEPLGIGEIGELIVQGPAVTRAYVTRTESNALAKIRDGDNFWHRIGDLGYLDAEDRFWFCGRKAHRLETVDGPMFTVCCEAIANQHPAIYRSALVGVGEFGAQVPALIVETWPEHAPPTAAAETQLLDEVYACCQKSELTSRILRSHFFRHPALPVDIRHNAKIFREKLAPWAAERLGDANSEGANSEGAKS